MLTRCYMKDGDNGDRIQLQGQVRAISNKKTIVLSQLAIEIHDSSCHFSS